MKPVAMGSMTLSAMMAHPSNPQPFWLKPKLRLPEALARGAQTQSLTEMKLARRNRPAAWPHASTRASW